MWKIKFMDFAVLLCEEQFLEIVVWCAMLDIVSRSLVCCLMISCIICHLVICSLENIWVYLFVVLMKKNVLGISYFAKSFCNFREKVWRGWRKFYLRFHFRGKSRSTHWWQKWHPEAGSQNSQLGGEVHSSYMKLELSSPAKEKCLLRLGHWIGKFIF